MPDPTAVGEGELAKQSLARLPRIAAVQDFAGEAATLTILPWRRSAGVVADAFGGLCVNTALRRLQVLENAITYLTSMPHSLTVSG